MNDETRRHEGQMGRWAWIYDPLMALMTYGKEDRLRRATVELARLKPGDRVMEVGCGTGSLALAAKRQVGPSGEVLGIDIAPEMIAVASRKAARKHVSASFRTGSFADLAVPDNSFDVVLCSFMIFHLPEDVRLRGFSEAYRVLKPGGHLFILDAALTDKQRRRSARLHDVRELASILPQHRFCELEMKETEFVLFGTRFWYLRAKAEKV